MRCYVHPEKWSTERIVLSSDETHHLARVLRAQVGEEITLFDGRGREAAAQILKITRHAAELEVLQQHFFERPPVQLTLIQAVPREQKMDWIIQKATELGLTTVVPVFTAHTLMRPKAADAEAKKVRWDAIALNAAKQCGTPWLPQIEKPRVLEDYLSAPLPFDLFLVGALAGDTEPLKKILTDEKKKNRKNIGILIGPEGDFTLEEVAAARRAGAKPVSLGDRVLRVETAALYAISILRYEFFSA